MEQETNYREITPPRLSNTKDVDNLYYITNGEIRYLPLCEQELSSYELTLVRK